MKTAIFASIVLTALASLPANVQAQDQNSKWDLLSTNCIVFFLVESNPSLFVPEVQKFYDTMRVITGAGRPDPYQWSDAYGEVCKQSPQMSVEEAIFATNERLVGVPLAPSSE